MGFFSDIIDSITGGDDAAKAAQKGANLAGDAAMQGARLSGNYIQEGTGVAGDFISRGTDAATQSAQQGLYFLAGRDRVPDQISTGAQRRLAGIYGLPGGERGSAQGVVNRALESPIYNAIMQTRDFGEDAIMRNASATGGLRSGNVQSNLYQYNQQLGANALAEAYAQQLSGLQGLSQLDTMDQEIANQFNEVGRREGQGLVLEGQTRGQGRVLEGQTRGQGVADKGRLLGLGETAAGQAIQSGRGGLLDLGAQLGGAALGNPELFSDPRLKSNVERIGERAGLPWYRWKWNELAASLGLSGGSEGFMADDVAEVHPEAVSERDGFLAVDYGAILGRISA